MAVVPVTKVYDAGGTILHDCADAGCDTSWDGYDLATGGAAEGRVAPGDQWDLSTPGEAHLKPQP